MLFLKRKHEIGLLSSLSIYLYSTILTFAQNADVKGALQTNKDALEAMRNSSLNQESLEKTPQTLTNILLYFCGFGGILVVAIGFYMIYSHIKEGEQARGSWLYGAGVAAIGSCMTIVGFFSAGIPNMILGN